MLLNNESFLCVEEIFFYFTKCFSSFGFFPCSYNISSCFVLTFMEKQRSGHWDLVALINSGMCVCGARSCLALRDPMDCTPGCSVYGIFQARTLEWVVSSYSRGSSQPRDWNRISWVSCIGRRILCRWATPPGKPFGRINFEKCWHSSRLSNRRCLFYNFSHLCPEVVQGSEELPSSP